MTNIAIFASGNGSNAEKIIAHFASSQEISIRLIVTNNPDAYVLERARNHGISSRIIDRGEFYASEVLLEELRAARIDFIVLAGFMWLVPAYLVKAYPKKMVNIHPALLPKFGGKGMYGSHVHEAVRSSGEKKTGITIHWVNEHYDEGAIICQESCDIDENDSAGDIAEKVHALEYEYYPKVIESIVKNS